MLWTFNFHFWPKFCAHWIRSIMDLPDLTLSSGHGTCPCLRQIESCLRDMGLQAFRLPGHWTEKDRRKVDAATRCCGVCLHTWPVLISPSVRTGRGNSSGGSRRMFCWGVFEGTNNMMMSPVASLRLLQLSFTSATSVIKSSSQLHHYPPNTCTRRLVAISWMRDILCLGVICRDICLQMPRRISWMEIELHRHHMYKTSHVFDPNENELFYKLEIGFGHDDFDIRAFVFSLFPTVVSS